jgi:hypothetical protein
MGEPAINASLADPSVTENVTHTHVLNRGGRAFRSPLDG